MTTIALSAFARLHNVPKSTVYKEARLIGLDTSHGLGYEDCLALQAELELTDHPDIIKHFKIELEPVKNDAQTAITPVTVQTIVKDVSMIPGSFSLDRVLTHFDIAPIDQTNSDQIVSVVTQLYNAAESTLTERVNTQADTLRHTQDALQQVQNIHLDKSVNLKLKALESQILANQQVKTTTDLQSLLNEVAALGNG